MRQPKVKLGPTADRVAADLYTRPINHNLWQETVIRDACDQATGSDLSASVLDRLAYMVMRRLHADTFWRWRAAQEKLHLAVAAKAQGKDDLARSYEASARKTSKRIE